MAHNPCRIRAQKVVFEIRFMRPYDDQTGLGRLRQLDNLFVGSPGGDDMAGSLVGGLADGRADYVIQSNLGGVD